MLDALKPMILEASRRCKKPSQIQKFVFKNYGYNVSREHIVSTIGDPKYPKMTKCDLCIDRIKMGLKPACVASCIGRALECGPIDELRKLHPGATIYALGFEPQNTEPSILFKSRVAPKGV